jgi:Na+/H+-translocating membrane pyrophosphatase
VAVTGGIVVVSCFGVGDMLLATDTNARTAQAGDEQYAGSGGGLGHALSVALTADRAISLTITSLGFLGVLLFCKV